MLYCQILLELCQFINVRFLQDFSNPDAEVVIDDHHIASGDALAVDQQIHIDAIRSGAKDFIVKPFKIERVLKTVTSIVGEP